MAPSVCGAFVWFVVVDGFIFAYRTHADDKIDRHMYNFRKKVLSLGCVKLPQIACELSCTCVTNCYCCWFEALCKLYIYCLFYTFVLTNFDGSYSNLMTAVYE